MFLGVRPNPSPASLLRISTESPANPTFDWSVLCCSRHGLWRTLTGGDTKAVGQTRVISERGGKVFAFRIAGVLPESFVFPLEMEDPLPI